MILDKKYENYTGRFERFKKIVFDRASWEKQKKSVNRFSQQYELPIDLIEEYREFLFNVEVEEGSTLSVENNGGDIEVKFSLGKDGNLLAEKAIPISKSLNDVVDFDELYSIFKVDKEKYNIVNYWGKVKADGRLWGTVQFTLRYGGVDVDSIKKVAIDFLKSLPETKFAIVPSHYEDDTVLICLSDQHIGAKTPYHSMIPNEYDKNEYLKRMNIVLNKAISYISKNNIQNVIVMGLGDALDGQHGKTAKGLLGKSSHSLPQNIDDRLAWLLYCDSTYSFVESLKNHFPDINISVRFVGDSNHGGDYEWWANHMIKEKLKQINVPCVVEDEFIGYFTIGERKVLYTHGSDSRCKKYMMDKTATTSLQQYIMQWCSNKGIVANNLILLKGDYHVHNMELTPQGYYITAGSLYGPSDYVAINYQNPSKGCTCVHVGKDMVNTMWIEL